MNYDDMTIEQLQALNIQLSNERAAIKARQREINKVLDQKRAAQSTASGQSAQVNTAGIKSRLEDGE